MRTAAENLDGQAGRVNSPRGRRFRRQSNLSRHLGTHGGSCTDHEYTLTRQGGEKLILDDGLKGAVFALMGPPLRQRYQAGEAMTFGPVTSNVFHHALSTRPA